MACTQLRVAGLLTNTARDKWLNAALLNLLSLFETAIPSITFDTVGFGESVLLGED